MMSIRDVLNELGVSFKMVGEHHHATENFVQVDCPFCGGNYLMGIHIARGFVRCWRCGPRRLTEALSALSNKSTSECKRLLVNIDWKPFIATEQPTGTLKIPSGVKPMMAQHRRYLKDVRRLDPDVIESLWGVQGIGIHKEYAWRLFIPITKNGKTVSWTTRSISDNVEARYKTARVNQEAYSHKKCLYGEEYCNHACIIHEGPIDVWSTGPGATCTFGLSFSRTQLLRLAKFTLRVVCLDSAKDAQHRAEELCDTLMLLPGKTLNVVLDAKDAGSASEKELRRLRKLIRQ